MGNPKIISYTPEMLIKENLERGVKKELLVKLEKPVEVKQELVQRFDNKSQNNGISEWCKKLRAEEAHLQWMSENEDRKSKIEDIEKNFNCCWEDKFKEACESYNYETAAESINLDPSIFIDWAEHLGLEPHYRKLKHKENSTLETDLFDNVSIIIKQEMSAWCKVLRSDESHLNWMKKNEMRINKIEEIERSFGCYWEDKFKEVCESYNLETAANAIDLDEAIFKNWAKHLNLNPHDKEVEHYQENTGLDRQCIFPGCNIIPHEGSFCLQHKTEFEDLRENHDKVFNFQLDKERWLKKAELFQCYPHEVLIKEKISERVIELLFEINQDININLIKDPVVIVGVISDEIIKFLPFRECAMFHMRFLKNEEMSLEEIGSKFNVTRERVRQIFKRILRKLRHPTRKRGIRDGILANLGAGSKGNLIDLQVEQNIPEENSDLNLVHVNKEEVLGSAVVLDQIPLEALPLSVRAKNGLDDIGVKTLGECRKLTFDELCLLRNIGRKSANEIIRVVADVIQGKVRIQDYLPEENKSLEEGYLINVLSLPLSEIKLSVRATNVISNLLGNKRIINLVQLDKNEILSMQNCGRSTLQEINDLLSDLGLKFNMKLSNEVKDKIKEFRVQKTVEQIIEEFKVCYPEKYTFLAEAFLKKTPPTRMEQYEECFRLYREGGTLEYVGKKLNLTRERIRQILKNGAKLGLFHYSPHKYPYLEKEKILKDYERLGDLNEVAKVNNVAVSYLKKTLTTYRLTDKKLKEIQSIGRKNKCVEEYQQIVAQLGHHPTTTELQSTNKGRALSMRILRLWGSTDNFRLELNIPKFVRTFPEISRQWVEKRQRLAFIIRMENLDKIRSYLSSFGLVGSTEIAYACNMKPPNVLRLLNLLLARGEISREGLGSAVKYKIIKESS